MLTPSHSTIRASRTPEVTPERDHKRTLDDHNAAQALWLLHTTSQRDDATINNNSASRRLSFLTATTDRLVHVYKVRIDGRQDMLRLEDNPNESIDEFVRRRNRAFVNKLALQQAVICAYYAVDDILIRLVGPSAATAGWSLIKEGRQTSHWILEGRVNRDDAPSPPLGGLETSHGYLKRARRSLIGPSLGSGLPTNMTSKSNSNSNKLHLIAKKRACGMCKNCCNQHWKAGCQNLNIKYFLLDNDDDRRTSKLLLQTVMLETTTDDIDEYRHQSPQVKRLLGGKLRQAEPCDCEISTREISGV